MKPAHQPPFNLPFSDPAYGYFEGMEDRTMRRIRGAETSKARPFSRFTTKHWGISGLSFASLIFAFWFFQPRASIVSLDQVNELELVQFLSQNADVNELASYNPQLIHPAMLPESLTAPTDSELDELLDASTYDQIQEL